MDIPYCYQLIRLLTDWLAQSAMFGTDLQTELWTDPLIMIVGPPGVFILVFYSLLLFPHHICVTVTDFFP